ncbi:hybrid sensor histidine kinase/response regulator [Pseudomonas koreensis]|uniref:hybrid sensor histidine kinase/response regulator n=1 Tax=Pseudomonas koreensis TaxID=198620 RepID=UPI002FC89CD2
MRQENHFRKFIRTALRLNRLLILSASSAFLLFAVTYVAVERLLEEQVSKIDFHFSRLMGTVHEHEAFLMRAVRQSDDATKKKDQAVIPLHNRLLKEVRGISIFEGIEFSFAMPFTLAMPTKVASLDEVNDIGRYGVLIANYYGSFWSRSSYVAPQTLLIDLDSSISMGIPAAEISSGAELDAQTSFLEQSEAIKRQILQYRPENMDEGHVRWAPAIPAQADGPPIQFIAYTNTDITDNLWFDNQKRQLVISTLLDLNSIFDTSRLSDLTVFDTMELITPEGLMLTRRIPGFHETQDGLTLTSAGLLIKVTAQDGWRGYYHLTYGSFFKYTKWHLLALLRVWLVVVVAGYFFVRWYNLKVVVPARRAHERIVESDTFSRTIIQGAPVALCVLARKDHTVVMENELARLWFGDEQSILQLNRVWRSVEPGNEADQRLMPISIRINDRQLEVSFSLSRYQGEEVVLCAFNDISSYKLAEQALAAAKQSSDASSEAKSIFLATMSHEIRTPLYGVLGTLELLSFSQLNNVQQSQVRTMQQSSTILLQIISDILDVSKIEAGQLALEQEEFSPLEMVEEVLQSYSAAAAIKGLHLYGCVDVDIALRVIGDVNRIRQILSNLVSNAIKFTDVGYIALRLKSERIEGVWYCQWQVTDTGCGIASKDQVHLFEPFYQVHNRQHTVGGTGLGLSICWRLTQMMSGSLSVISDKGLGSSFTLELPLAVVPGERALLPEMALRSEAVVVRAPIKELAVCVRDWLTRFGALAVIGTDVSEGRYPHAVLVDVMPELLSDLAWSGRRIACSESGLLTPQHTSNGYTISLYSLRDLLRAVALSQGVPLAADDGVGVISRWCRFSLHALVAEDNPINQTLLKEQLEQLGCSVTLASDGVQALRLWEHDAFDVILTDVNMPQMNGYELTVAIRRDDSHTPIIGVTANAMREEEERCVGVGMNACIVKPILLSTLHDALLSLCGHLDGAVLPGEDPLAGQGILQVSSQLREVFIQTFNEDLVKIRAALQGKDVYAVCALMHRIRGGLSVVQAQSLLDRCAAIEARLNAHGWGDDSAREIEEVLASIKQEMEEL